MDSAQPLARASRKSANNSDRLVVRFACVFISAYEDDEREEFNTADFVEAIGKSLAGDARITAIAGGSADAGGISFFSFFPRPSGMDELLAAPRKSRAPQWFDPFKLIIRVPKKNQPLAQVFGEAPTEEYHAIWNGSCALVFWPEHGKHFSFVPGGQIVRDVLRETGESAGYETRTQGPSMAHVDVVVTTDAKADAITYSRSNVDRHLFELVFPMKWDRERVEELTFVRLHFMALVYYQLCNISERVREVEGTLNDIVEKLLLLHYDRSLNRFSLRHPREWMVRIWTNRGWRGQSEEFVGGIWLAAARLQSLRAGWQDLRRHFDELVAEVGGFSPFQDHITDMDHEVHELDVGLASRIVEHTESRIGVSYVVVATIIAAIVGAIAGALAGHFVH
jgi:hypothetical protein